MIKTIAFNQILKWSCNYFIAVFYDAKSNKYGDVKIVLLGPYKGYEVSYPGH